MKKNHPKSLSSLVQNPGAINTQAFEKKNTWTKFRFGEPFLNSLTSNWMLWNVMAGHPEQLAGFWTLTNDSQDVRCATFPGCFFCYWLRSDVTTRTQACFGHCKRCKKCVFLRACHVHCHAGLGWGGMGWVNIRCTWTHVWCYATVGVGVGWDGMC